MLEEYLRHYVRSDQSDWVDLLDAAQFSYNMQKSSATGFSPFELATGQQPLAPHTVSKGFHGPSPSAMLFMKRWQDQVGRARTSLTAAADRMKRYADRKRRDVEFKVGDRVFLKMSKEQFRPPAGMSYALTRRYEGPFEIIQEMSNGAYKLKLPENLKTVHPVVHVSQLRPCWTDADDPSRAVPSRAPALVMDRPEREVEKVLAHRFIRHGRTSRHEYLVKWKDLPETENSWEWREALWKYVDKMQEFEDRTLGALQLSLNRCCRGGNKTGGGGCNILAPAHA